MSDAYEILGMTIVGIVVIGIAGAAVSFGYTNSISEIGNNASDAIQGDEPWENMYFNKSDASRVTPENSDDEGDNNPVMNVVEGGGRKRKQTKSKKPKKNKKTQKKHKRRNK
jgi:hypothetical protein